MKTQITDVLGALLGRRTTWRLGRSLYLKARADSPNVAQFNGEELLQRQLLARFSAVQEKLVAFDVGANIGDWTWFILQETSRLNMGSRVEIYSFEPTPSTFKVLQERISKHQLQNISHLVPKALSNEDGTAEMYVTGETAGTNSLHPDAINRNQSRIQIDKTTAYAYCSSNGIQVIHFLKCDTEGHDMTVLQGAKKLFDEQRIMACQFEYNHRWIYSRHYLKDVFDMFEGTPYSIGKITPNGIELYQGWHPELERFFEGNYILLHSKALNWFTTVTGKHDEHNTYCAQSAHA
ncbi:MAG: FkbM family methyltransferase [Pseudomonadota bacterium]